MLVINLRAIIENQSQPCQISVFDYDLEKFSYAGIVNIKASDKILNKEIKKFTLKSLILVSKDLLTREKHAPK